MEGDRSHTVAIMAAVIYASRTEGTGFKPSDKTFAAIADEAWALYKAVMGGGEVQHSRAGFGEP
ncbi:MAG: hypothetical protein H0T68_03210 [Gemmatimonadales bacterium]|nr:hypothetical protein [Gemmatimonadales bacterium]